MAKPRYRTQSRFKLAAECPAKRFYSDRRDRYHDATMKDPFLAALARGDNRSAEWPSSTSPAGWRSRQPSSGRRWRSLAGVWPSPIPVIYKVALRHGSAMSERPEAMVPKGRTGVTQALPSVESAAIGLWTWDVR